MSDWGFGGIGKRKRGMILVFGNVSNLMVCFGFRMASSE